MTGCRVLVPPIGLPLAPRSFRLVSDLRLYSQRKACVVAETEDWKAPLPAVPTKPSIVALGKFDALHVGHRSASSAPFRAFEFQMLIISYRRLM